MHLVCASRVRGLLLEASSMKTPSRFIFCALACLAIAATGHLALAQGTLTPPSAPTPTMKSLDQIDTHVDTAAAAKRILINSTTAPGDSGSVYIISQPGSYYLAGNLNGAGGKNGITINADNVTVDLNGFALIGALGSSDGIHSIKNNVGVRNGTIRSWGGDGVFLVGENQTMERLRLSDNIGDGVDANGNCVITNCAAHNNTNAGISFVHGTATGCAAGHNTGPGFAVVGGTIKDCTASFNATGFDVTEAVVTGCYADSNSGDGFLASVHCLISGNNSVNNGGNGFLVNGSLNRIDGNTAISNQSAGIRWANDLVIRNNCYTNAAGNYIPSSGGAMGPIQAASTATNPFANF